MSKLHPVSSRDWTPVHYTAERWALLRSLRERAASVLEALLCTKVKAVVIGSVARGDVTPTSDIDVHLDSYAPTHQVVSCLQEHGYGVAWYEVIQAAPNSAVRIVVYIDESLTVSIPASKLSKTEEEFPLFAGCLNLDELRAGKRVPGVNKRLLLIVPTVFGHVESSILGREVEVAKMLGISVETVKERVAVRLKRVKEGRSGFYLHKLVPPNDSPERVLFALARANSLLARKLEGVLL
uniref:DNA polymerase subunit beta n=1 Tax=Thermofilum pendens TaxID=2269 RepID=A0A7C1T1U1_THEPE